MPDDASAGQPEAPSFVDAVKSSAVVAALTFGLAVPIIALRTEQDINNQLVLVPRWGLVLQLVGIAFVVNLLGRMLLPHVRSGLRGKGAALTGLVPRAVVETFPSVGLALIALFPVIMMATVGPSGAIKWVDNYGVQILIYVMLGWGLNIVVGLAGLLDLGYVAFYAVGAYAYAIIATKVIPATAPALGVYAFWICLPIAGLLAALWGIILGFPVLRLRGDYLAIVTLAFGEIIRLVLINWIDFSNGYAGIQTPRITFFGLPFTSPKGERTFSGSWTRTSGSGPKEGEWKGTCIE